MPRRRDKFLLAAPVLLLLLGISGAAAEDGQVNTIMDISRHLNTCWRPPPIAKVRPIDITVIVSFNRSGEIMGHPRISYESADASDSDRLQYRIAVMEALQRCTPMPFTESMAGAVAGHPFAVKFHNSHKPQEKRAWLLPKIL
jgi:hypothetical protein